MPVEIPEDVKEEVRRAFKALEGPVKIYFFRGGECTYCSDIEEILDVLAGLSDKITVEKHEEGSELAGKLGIDMFPAVVVHGAEPYNIRFFGAPFGYEFGALVEDILDASHGQPSNLDRSLARQLREGVRRPTRIRVFVTPTCPYCPFAVRAAHRYAMVNPNIYGDMIESMEFPELANEYGVYAVPKIVIEVDGVRRGELEGAVPDRQFVEEILRAQQ